MRTLKPCIINGLVKGLWLHHKVAELGQSLFWNVLPTNGGLPRLGISSWDPKMKDESILGPILGSPDVCEPTIGNSGP